MIKSSLKWQIKVLAKDMDMVRYYILNRKKERE
jgi:hypothetical protein